MHNGIVNRRDKLQANNVNRPKLDTAFVTDNVSEHIVEIIDDHKEEIKPIIGGNDFQYSEDEQDSGLKWINGEHIYVKTFRRDFTEHGSHMISIDPCKIVRHDFDITTEGGNMFFESFPSQKEILTCGLRLHNHNTNQIEIWYGSGFGENCHVVVTIWYIKNTEV